MTLTEDTMTAKTVLHAARQLAPSILDRAGEIEAARRVPTDLLEQLRAAGCFRLLRPATHGGLEAALPDAMRGLESLARADASVAWTVMIGAGSWIDLAHLPRETFDALYAGNPDAITAGVFNPTGAITPVDGGYRVTGRWSSPAGASTPTCSSATALRAWSTACRSCAAPCSHRPTSRSRTRGTCQGCAVREATTSTSTTPSSRPGAPSHR
ncbi:MAG: acyl-CoA dehydrogenase family protein [Acidimicrobiales bacterium]